MAFNNNRNRSGDQNRGGGFRPRPKYNDRGPVEMHRATCDNCRKECEVPFKPSSGKPIFCSSCFENQRNSSGTRRSETKGYERSNYSDERQMFDAVCADCGNNCQVPFQVSGDKPVFCSDCFAGKKRAGGERESGSSRVQEPQYRQEFEMLNNKLERILQILDPQPLEQEAAVPEESGEVLAADKEVVRKTPKPRKPKVPKA